MSDPSTNLSRGLLVVLAIGCLGLAFALAVSTTNSSILRAKLRQAEAAGAPTAPDGAGPSGDRLAALEELLRERDAAYARLQQQYADAEKRLAAVRTGDSETRPGVASVPTNAPPAPPEGRRSWLERLKTEDPERYAQIQQDREERRQRAAMFFESQLDRLDERYRVAQTRQEVELLEQIADKLVRLDELRQQWTAIRELPQEERRAQARELGAASMQTYYDLVRLRVQDRQLQLDQLARQVGYDTETDAATFVTAVQQIFDETDTNPMQFMGGGHGFGHRRPAP